MDPSNLQKPPVAAGCRRKITGNCRVHICFSPLNGVGATNPLFCGVDTPFSGEWATGGCRTGGVSSVQRDFPCGAPLSLTAKSFLSSRQQCEAASHKPNSRILHRHATAQQQLRESKHAHTLKNAETAQRVHRDRETHRRARSFI